MTPDYIGHCLDAAVPLILGIIGMIYYPYRIAKNIQSKKYSVEEGKNKLKRVLIAYGLIALLGILQIIWLFH